MPYRPSYPEESLPSDYQTYMHLSKYSRWRGDLTRRETWPETVDRYLDFWEKRYPDALRDYRPWLRTSLLELRAVPSMRCLMTAGPALTQDECAGYNCTYVAINRPEAWDEAMYLLMCGVGVGYSVESHNVAQLPEIPAGRVCTGDVIRVADSKVGWASALRELVSELYAGRVPSWDTSGVRPSGAILETFGGRASGPEPLERLFRHVVATFKGACGRRLTELEVHSICCLIGDIVVVGGVRRSAMIALFSRDDQVMMRAKTGDWFDESPHLGMANNSAVYDDSPRPDEFLDLFSTLIRSGSGEPGIFNRQAAQRQAARWGLRSAEIEYGVNPCGEIILRDMQMCNLSEAIARPGDSVAHLLDKVEVATIFGTLQSSLTNFRYLDPQWRENCEAERLLGVSIAGIPDHPLLRGDEGESPLRSALERLREHVWRTNTDWAQRLGVSPSKAACCLKPSGNTSQLVDAASPLKAWHAPKYVRRTRGTKTDPVSRLLIDQGVPHEDEAWHPDTTVVFDWPQRAPAGAVTRADWTALQQLRLWLTYKRHWCDHNPSVTVNVEPQEWIGVASWVHEHWSDMVGVAFLPDEDHTYVQAPYEELSDAKFAELVESHPAVIDWSQLPLYELEDMTESARELSCTAGGCSI